MIDKKLWPEQHSPISLSLVNLWVNDLGVKHQGQMTVMMVHNTLSNGRTLIYQRSLTYLKRQKKYSPYKFGQLFDLGVKYQGQINYVMMEHDTSSNGHAPIYQMSLTYLERQKVMAQTILANYLASGSKVKANESHDAT